MDAYEKRCTKCGEVKPAVDFYSRRGMKAQAAERLSNALVSACKSCSNAGCKAWREAHPDRAKVASRTWHVANRDRANANRKARYTGRRDTVNAARRSAYSADAEVWARVALCSARNRAAKRGVPCTITVDNLLSIRAAAKDKCPALGVPLIYGAEGRPRPNSASVDCINPAIGYVPGNVVILSRRANSIKSDATPAELRLVANFTAKIEAVSRRRLADITIQGTK